MRRGVTLWTLALVAAYAVAPWPRWSITASCWSLWLVWGPGTRNELTVGLWLSPGQFAAGVFLPGHHRPACDFAVQLDGDGALAQYPDGERTIAVRHAKWPWR